MQMRDVFAFAVMTCCLANFAQASVVSGGNADYAQKLFVTDEGNYILVGSTYSNDLIQDRFNKTTQDSDVFIIQWNPSLNQGEAISFIEGNEQDVVRGAARDTQGNIYLALETNSSDLPVTIEGHSYRGGWDAYIAKLTPEGNLLLGAYIGGDKTDYAHAIDIDDDGNIYLAGETNSADFPTTANALIPNCIDTGICNSYNGFIAKFQSNGTSPKLSYSTLLGGQAYDSVHAIKIDSLKRLHVGGETLSDDFPLSFPSYQQRSGEYDGFVALFDLNQSDHGLIYSSYLGGDQYDSVRSIATTDSGQTIVVGETASSNFPVSDKPIATTCAMGKLACNDLENFHTDIFVTVIDHVDHTLPKYSTLLGGKGDEIPSDILWHRDQIYITGSSWSNDFPTTQMARKKLLECSPTCTDVSAGFVARIDFSLQGSKGLTYASYLDNFEQSQPRSFGLGDEQLHFFGESNSLSSDEELILLSESDYPQDTLNKPQANNCWFGSNDFLSVSLGFLLLLTTRLIAGNKHYLVA